MEDGSLGDPDRASDTNRKPGKPHKVPSQFSFIDSPLPKDPGFETKLLRKPRIKSDVSNKSGTFLHEYGGQNHDDVQVSYIDSLCPEDSGVRYQAPSESPDLASDGSNKPGTLLS